MILQIVFWKKSHFFSFFPFFRAKNPFFTVFIPLGIWGNVLFFLGGGRFFSEKKRRSALLQAGRGLLFTVPAGGGFQRKGFSQSEISFSSQRIWKMVSKMFRSCVPEVTASLRISLPCISTRESRGDSGEGGSRKMRNFSLCLCRKSFFRKGDSGLQAQ